MTPEAVLYAQAMSNRAQGLRLSAVEQTPDAAHILYDLLGQRDPAARISARQMPDFDTHCAFVQDHPYRAWMLIRLGAVWVGSVYLGQDNAVGLHLARFDPDLCQTILRKVLEKIPPLPPVASVRAARFIVNVGPNHEAYEHVLVTLGAAMVQKTYLLPDKGA